MTRLDELVLPILALLVLLLSGAVYWTRTHQPAPADRLPPRVKWTLDHGYLYVRRLGPTN